jgi:hypothetical protein
MREKKPKPRLQVRNYCEVETVTDDKGNAVWPAPTTAMEEARAFISEWYAWPPKMICHCQVDLIG